MGSLKVFLFAGAALLAPPFQFPAAATDGPFEIPKSRICEAIGVAEAACDRDVSLAVNPLAREAHPALHWHIERTSGRDGVLKVECADFACVPFLVMVRDRQSSRAPYKPPSRQDSPRAKSVPVIHRGDRLTLIREGEGVRLTTTAVSLSPGRVGDSIYVREYGSSHRVSSVVVDAHTVVASY